MYGAAKNTSNIREIAKYTPAFEPVSLREPSEIEKEIDATLQEYMNAEMSLESDEEMTRRDAVLIEVRNIFIKWVHYVSTEILCMPEDEAEDAGGELFISGSHRLGVRDVGADIDTVCVAPNFCTREHFFMYLKNSLLNHPDVTELNAVEDALVPVISFDFRGVSIDLLFARLAANTVPKDIDILDDNILLGLDDATEKSLNGPRVTNMIFKLVGEKTFPNFLIVLRCIRRWAKRRGIYGNKLGYLGGVNCNILVAFVCQLYPKANPSTLLFQFFRRYHNWKWPEPIMLNNIQSNPPELSHSEYRDVWSQASNPNHYMPIITPAYPAMNSSYNVSLHTLEVMKQEFKRGYEITQVIIREKGGEGWHRLFEPSDFFIKYSHYLQCHIVGNGENPESRSWIGFVESRLRRFIPFLETLPLKMPIQLHPVMSKTQKSNFSVCYFIGFNLDMEAIAAMPDKNIRINDCVYRFQESLLDPDRGYKGFRFEGIDFFVEHMEWRKLPKEIFETTGGRDAAKAKRQALLGISSSSTSSRKRKNSFGSSSDLVSPIAATASAAVDADGLVKVEPAAVKSAIREVGGRKEAAATGTEAKATDSKTGEGAGAAGEDDAVDNAVAMNLDSKFAVAVSDGSQSSKRIKFSSLVEGKKERKVLPSLLRLVPPARQPYRFPTKVTWLLLDT